MSHYLSSAELAVLILDSQSKKSVTLDFYNALHLMTEGITRRHFRRMEVDELTSDVFLLMSRKLKNLPTDPTVKHIFNYINSMIINKGRAIAKRNARYVRLDWDFYENRRILIDHNRAIAKRMRTAEKECS